ncbi:MAG: ubiquinone/menaquinone biosynthesis methyltransferase [Pseudomonadales bacterium]|nr:ubiquinone/menaquinone biosynthesis methyltransferase [Pseudomonadales bacterium]
MTEVNFGHRKVSPDEKTELVGEVFGSVARRYDIMNDFMSFGTHRLFKRMVLESSGVRPGDQVLDLAGGTGDMSALFARAVGPSGHVFLTDLNSEMMTVGKERLYNGGIANVSLCRAPAEALPFADATFNVACISFGIRNFTDKDASLKELLRVLKPGAPLLVLEFSKPEEPLLKNAYRAFQSLWPLAGQAIVGDSGSYRYLVESIEVHPDQKALKQMFLDAGFEDVEYHNLVGGIAAIHRGTKPL